MAKKISPDLEALMRFVRLTNDFRLVRRTFLVRGREDNENDAEHSYQIAMCAWFLNDRLNLNLELEKILRYALIHDLVEVYAGDTPTVGIAAKNTSVNEKQIREKKAFERIREEWMYDFPSMIDAMESYGTKADPESLLVYTLDKTITKLNNIEDNGRNWHHNPTTLEEIDSYTRPKVEKFPPVSVLYKEIYELLKENPSLFPPPLKF